ncbi:signal recognition particle-docking protein FtsY [Beijerinckia mobilis]|uniref:signal recognition particle-docking protein FtsY n=1 Tax=Beijerinckia mobilis TaxID=231434 RepID=UPI0005516481|nr:signal recognition particle-docking protein FtsY [Beijerinckia mobilis]
MAEDSSPNASQKRNFLKRLFTRKEDQVEAAQPEHAEEAAREPSAAGLASGAVSPTEAIPLDQSIAEPSGAPAAPVPPPAHAAETEPAQGSWWSRLRAGLSRSSNSIGSGIVDIFTKRKLDEDMLQDLEDILIRADLGGAVAQRITETVGKGRFNWDVDPAEVKAILAHEVETVLGPYARPLEVDVSRKPFVILVVGVNGSGKTTTIGKLAAQFTREGRKVMLAAGDTFRAAAIEQLQIWGQRLGCNVIARPQGSDAAGLAFDAIKAARAEDADILLMDTAGRLQNRAELMDELEKIIRVMRKQDAEAPHAVLLVLDATVGQNALSQVEIFGRVAGVTGLVMTKLDGTARGGILVAITEKFKLPIHYIGVGEKVDDLEAFTARDFGRAIAGLDREAVPPS